MPRRVLQGPPAVLHVPPLGKTSLIWLTLNPKTLNPINPKTLYIPNITLYIPYGICNFEVTIVGMYGIEYGVLSYVVHDAVSCNGS